MKIEKVRHKTKLSLERLKMEKVESSSLVLEMENEQQRQRYEKCLDEIANHVVQALLARSFLDSTIEWTLGYPNWINQHQPLLSKDKTIHQLRMSKSDGQST
ncbi:unnamed protein product [Lymnaea stagnalis]|uniref:Uncharacterized protein n=1 Tax=Lymnaea stagnalis TaxID=6523 RepID=A0AAV2HYL7_LYMST